MMSRNPARTSPITHSQQFVDDLQEISDLKAKLYNAECEILDLESELMETRALLGEAVVTASKRKSERVPFPVSATPLVQTPVRFERETPRAGPSNISAVLASSNRKRVRSPSIELIDCPMKAIKLQGKTNTNQTTEKMPNPAPTTGVTPATSKSYPSPSGSSTRASDPGKTKRMERTEVKAPQIRPPFPKKEIKGEPRAVLNLPQSVLQSYLDSVKPLVINPPPLELEVPRAFLRLAYGGNDQQFLQFIPEEYNPSALTRRRMVFPMLDMNPAMPSAPGEPGLVFASRHEILKDPPWTLFCKRDGSKAIWLYLGEYKSELCGEMTAEQFRSQRRVVQQEWAKSLKRQKAFDVYVRMRARIALRKDESSGFVSATPEAAAKMERDEIAAVKADRGRPVEEDDIITAFSRGDEAIDIIRMQCIEYDHIFVNDMRGKYPNYATLQAAHQQKKKANSKAVTAGKTPRKLRKANRKTKEKDDDSDASYEVTDEGLASDEDYVDPLHRDINAPTPSSRPRRFCTSNRMLSTSIHDRGDHDVEDRRSLADLSAPTDVEYTD